MKQHNKPANDRAQKRLLLGLGDGMSLNDAARRAGVSFEEAKKRVLSLRHLIASNDSNIDDFIREAELIESSANLRSSESRSDHEIRSSKRRSILEAITENLEPDDLRELASTLLKVADAVDQDWHPETTKSVFSWPSAAARIERSSLKLARRAKALLHFRRERAKTIPAELLGEPAWEMLLDLFCQFSGGAAVSLKSLTIASGASATTALRIIDKLEAEGLIQRRSCPTDGRVTLVELTKKGVLAVGHILEKCPDHSS